MQKNVKKYTGVLLVSSVLIGGIASAAITPAFPGTLPNAVSGAVIKASDINTLVTALDNLNQRVPANLELITVNPDGDLSLTGGVYTQKNGWLNVMGKSYSNATGQVSFAGLRARGTIDTPTAVQNGDGLSQFIGRGYNGTTFPNGGQSGMKILASEDHTPTANGTEIKFSTTPNGHTSSANRMTIAANGNVGIGTTDPTSKLDVNGTIRNSSNGSSSIDSLSFSDNVSVSSYFVGKRARGTEAAPTAAQSGDNLGVFTARGYNGTEFPTSGNTGMVVKATENHTATANGTRLVFQNIANGTTNPLSRMVIAEDGRIGVGVTDPVARMDINGPLKIGASGLACDATTEGMIVYTGTKFRGCAEPTTGTFTWTDF